MSENLSRYPIEDNLSPIGALTFSKSGGWWRAIVHSEDQYGNEKVRLYLWHDNDAEGWVTKHKWNIDPEHWPAERRIVEEYVGAAVDANTPYFPVQHYDVVGGQTITKTETWWTAVVQYETDYSSTHETRLYMWQREDDTVKGTGFKWNINTDSWPEERDAADRYVESLQ
ncbi:hypothetical protein SAMN06266787_10821 [Halorubrum ezzemoulense]|jgi:hypothetical protein|uniref:Uncharacterized protein n=1 Tax=Halorubrum ezzemoulense TaxID=337243 RepID=A0A238Y4X1_HALEZ|nr:hypothetical protein [Halorubrum ezzemoulense]SNR65369.1 hypothetical protein SAMN06266787_10821 [Halorubrum ezzemoulense]